MIPSNCETCETSKEIHNVAAASRIMETVALRFVQINDEIEAIHKHVPGQGRMYVARIDCHDANAINGGSIE